MHYQNKLSKKTKLLNKIRKLFTYPLFENILVFILNLSRHYFLVKLIPPNYLYANNNKRTIKKNGIKYNLDISDSVDHYVYFGFQDKIYSLISDKIKNAKVILDIGANIGYTALTINKINPGAKIYAFEPHPNTFRKANHNVQLNNSENIILYNIGLSNYNNTVRLYEVNPNNSGMNRILLNQNDYPYVEIEVKTLDDFLIDNKIDRIDILKIDVEGYEYNVLTGGSNAIKKYKPAMIIEINDQYLREKNTSAKELFNLLIEFGYTKFQDANTLSNFKVPKNLDHCHYDLYIE
jgi:FkbM family methyltransferase